MSNGIDVAGMRKPYHGKQNKFDIDDLKSKDPIVQFSAWFKEACKHESIIEANAMCLATATREGKPSLRMVLLKGYDEHGFKFYTNYESRKSREMVDNSSCSLLFYWTVNTSEESWSRQVRVEGSVKKISEEESTRYFHSRPKPSQIAVWCSKQSSVIANRDVLQNKSEDLSQTYKDTEVPKPDFWGGWQVVPEVIEFWQGQTDRLHDRIVFRRLQEGEVLDADVTHIGENGWVFERLAP